MRLCLVANPTSGLGAHGSASQETLTSLLRAGHDVVVAHGASYDETRLAATNIMEGAQGLDALIVVGGDGTVHLGLDVVATTSVPLGIVAVGTGNDIARQLGLPIRDVAGAVDVINKSLAAGGRTVSLDAIHASRPDGSPVPDEHEWSLAVVSGGIDAVINLRANRLRWPEGESRYLIAALRELARLRPYGYRVRTDHGTWCGEAVLLAVANTRYIGGGLEIVPQADPADGLLDVIRLDPVGRPRLLRLLQLLLKGRHVGQAEVHVETSRTVTIEACPAHGNRWLVQPPRPMADGEAVADLPLRLEAVRHAVRVLVSAPRSSGRHHVG